MDARQWTEATEVADIQSFDVGCMPLVDSPFERGKSGFKLIQCMACALPVIASPVGVDAEIVTDGETGFLRRRLTSGSALCARSPKTPWGT